MGDTSKTLGLHPLSTITTSVSSGTTTARDVHGRNPLYGSTGRIGSTNRIEYTGPSVLVARVGANAGSVYAVDGMYGVTDNTLVIRLKPGHSVSFVTELLKHAKLNRMVYGSGQPLVTGTMLRRLEIPAVSKGEQARIAEALNSAGSRITALERLIAKKQAIKQGMMQQLLTGRTRLPGFTDKWRETPLVEVSTMKGRIGWQGLTQDEFTSDSRQPFLITGMNFKDGAIRWDEVYHVPERRYAIAPEIQLRVDDVLMTKDGTIGKLLYVDAIPSPGRATLNSHLLVFRPKNFAYIPRFLYYQLSSLRFSKHVELYKSGTTFFGISQESVGKYQMLLPSLEEQAAIARTLFESDMAIERLNARLAKATAVKVGMMQQLLTGRTLLPIKEVAS